MLNEVKHLYSKDSSLTLRMTVFVNMYVFIIKILRCPFGSAQG